MPVHSRPIVVPDPDPSLNWVVSYKQALALQIVLARTKDLLVNVETTDFEGLFKIRWPLDKNGNKVPPNRIHRYLKARYVTWKCFCVVDPFTGTRRVRFTTKPDGTVMVYCGFIPSRCPYKLNLSKIYRRIEITPSKYEHYPTSFDRMAYRAALFHLFTIADENSGHHHHHPVQGNGNEGQQQNALANEGQGDVVVPMQDSNEGGEASAGGGGGEDSCDNDDDIDDDYDWGVHECCGELMDDPNEFVVPILDGWLGFGAGNPSDYSAMLEWVPGKFGWPVREVD